MKKYSAVMRLGGHSNVTLLRELATDRLVVQRIAGAKQAQTYQTLKKIAAPHIPAIYDITDIGNGQYEILEEYIDGRTLEDLLSEKGQFDIPSAAVYVTQLCEALEKLHKAGLIHRDIKPGNIILTPSGDLCLIDFDIARTHRPEGDSDTEILGTQGYAAPEQFGFHQTGAQTDIYSIGVLLNKLLTGKMPNECFTKGSIAYVVRRCLQMDTVRRYRSARALKKALQHYLPKGHPQALHFVRKIPGFRSFTGWKMALATICYAFLLFTLVLVLPELSGLDAAARVVAAASFLYYLFLFFFLFDLLRIRSRIAWLERSRGRWHYLPKCVLTALFLLAVLSSIGAWLETILRK